MAASKRKNSSRARKAKATRRRRAATIRGRRNQEAGADFPFETVVEVEAVRFHQDGTVDLFLNDADIPAQLAATENRRRRANKKTKARKKNRKRK